MGCLGGEALTMDWKMVEGSGQSTVVGILMGVKQGSQAECAGRGVGRTHGQQSQEPCTALDKQLH